jgi:hypothetical protein
MPHMGRYRSVTMLQMFFKGMDPSNVSVDGSKKQPRFFVVATGEVRMS